MDRADDSAPIPPRLHSGIAAPGLCEDAQARVDDRAKVSRMIGDARRRRAASKRMDRRSTMKGLNQQKSEKKKPTKSLKEKRAEKQQKKAAKGR
jgi:hypothetical protein